MKYRKKPVEIEAVRWSGENFDEVKSLDEHDQYNIFTTDNGIYIPTLEGFMLGEVGDYIIKGDQGELYPCNPDIFYITYDIVD